MPNYYQYFIKEPSKRFVESITPKLENTPPAYKAPTLCFDLMEMVGKQVDLLRIKQEHKKNISPVLESIKQTGGWTMWHFDEDQEPPIEWCIYGHIDGVWGDIVDNNPAGAFWIHELLDAEIENYDNMGRNRISISGY
mgnify:CR=1 FL=1|tara:strand:+ start:462 stop:875 length:414 start_codon:yes stop_codon:yes gene_type:complete